MLTIISCLILVSAVFYLYHTKLLDMWIAYVAHGMRSNGAFMRVALNALAGVALLLFSKIWKKKYNDFNSWKSFATINFIMFALLIIFNISTLVDRLTLYLFPLQIVVFSRIKYLIKDKNLKNLYYLFLMLLYTAVFTCLLFALHRDSYIPYNNILEVLL